MTDHHIRSARSDDAERIAEFATHTFDWGDYVADGFTEWLDEPDTAVPVVVDSDDVVDGIARVRLLSPREGWLSAVRIHPDRRRSGLANRLNEWSVAWIASQGGLVARLQIEPWNEPAQHQVQSLGFRPVGRVLNAIRTFGDAAVEPATNGGQRVVGPERLDKAPGSEGHLAYAAWSSSSLARGGRMMIAASAWEWRRLTIDDLVGGSLWHCPAGWALVDASHGFDMLVRWIMCSPEDGPRLIGAIIDLAHGQKVDVLTVVTPSTDWLREEFARRLFDVHETIIFEKPIT